jgi:hypothetical protein
MLRYAPRCLFTNVSILLGLHSLVKDLAIKRIERFTQIPKTPHMEVSGKGFVTSVY